MPLKDTPIQRKLTTIILLICAVVMLLMGTSFFTYEFFMFRNTTLRQLATLGEITATNSTAALAFDNYNDAKDILARLGADQQIAAASLYDRHGEIYARHPESACAYWVINAWMALRSSVLRVVIC